jgi:predicted small secreted protein
MRRYAADPNCPQPSVYEVNRLCGLVKNGMEVEELSNFSEEEIVRVLKSKKQEFGKIIGSFCEGSEERLRAVERAAQILNLNDM